MVERQAQLRPSAFRHRPSPSRRGFAIIEAVISTVIIAVLLVAAMRAAASSNLTQYKTAERATGRMLAQGLLAEILAQAYQEPTSAVLFGRESGESSTSRANYDDVDDYNGYTETPPMDKSGATIANLTGWQRSVAVAWVNLADPATVSTSETGVKRITVTVRHNTLVIATCVAIRTDAP
jgi:MSHA pilin protein MshD